MLGVAPSPPGVPRDLPRRAADRARDRRACDRTPGMSIGFCLRRGGRLKSRALYMARAGSGNGHSDVLVVTAHGKALGRSRALEAARGNFVLASFAAGGRSTASLNTSLDRRQVANAQETELPVAMRKVRPISRPAFAVVGSLTQQMLLFGA